MMSGAPNPVPEVIIAQHQADGHRLSSHFDESALDDESDDEISVHTSAIRRFSRRQSQNTEPIETAGILSTRERRASRRESQAARGAELYRRSSGTPQPGAGSSTTSLEASTLRQKAPAPTFTSNRQLGSTSSINFAAADSKQEPTAPSASSSSLPAFLLKSDVGLPVRRLSRTAQIIAEERGGTLPPAHSHSITLPDASIGLADIRNDTIREVDTVPPTPAGELDASTFEIQEAGTEDPRATGKIASWRGATILATACFAQLCDNIWMTSINIAVPRIAEEFDLVEGSQSWLVSAYTLTFGGFLLLAGVLSDRFGRRYVFSLGMLWMTVFSIACGVSRSGVQCIIFRALQGLGAAASVPSAIGVLSNFFVGNERHRALSMFGAAGAVGFVVGLILGGILSGTLGWRYIFYINAPIILLLSILGWLSFPKENRHTGRKPSLDFPGAALGTSGMVLMTFALSQSEVSGWNKPVIIVTLILSSQIQSWHLVLRVLALLLPMGAIGFIVSIYMGHAVEQFELKLLLIIGFFVAAVGTLPAAFVKAGVGCVAVGTFAFTDVHYARSGPRLVFPTTCITVIGVSISYNVASIALVSAVPPAAKSLAGGLINTAFQIGSGFGLAITSLVNETVLKRTPNPEDPSSIMKGYQAALFTSSGLVGGSLILTLFAIRAGQQATAGMIVH
ncbi:hypothetical protein D9758_007625 [Tetrapyrgos nigripes]|uniref:Major facilitator superfamily (MFS) profile domain-containing protein n=1 Tax=Tetrapyrgos nigripes TaxID=182062 RepID=A0A8H5G814_9AGAR|nr:hypothetical protein D9758_007625 [Tetrapyrgos nigripes]